MTPARGRLQNRIVALFVVLLAAVQLAAFYLIREAAERTARSAMREELRVADRVFHRLLAQNSQRLLEATRVLAADFGFREAVATRESETILEALRNHSGRIRASGMALLDLDGTVVADTLDVNARGGAPPHADLVAEAHRAGSASGIRTLRGQAYQVVIVPVLAPVPIAWVSVSFKADDELARDLKRLTSTEVTFVEAAPTGTQVLASTVAPADAAALAALAPGVIRRTGEPSTLEVGGEEHEVLAGVLHERAGGGIYAILQRPVAQGLAAFGSMQALLAALALGSLAVTVVAARRIASRVAQPVSQLAAAARRVARGDYSVRVPAAGGDEVGELAAAFNGMAQGLAERDTMRDVLGKVASGEVVEQLLAGHIALGGVELDAAVMFTDLRNYTALAERLTPTQNLQLLNEYLTAISAEVEGRGGVVDKYLGDGMMAVFGAPVPRPDDVQRAVEAALSIRGRVAALRPRMDELGLPHPEVGIGLNAGRVVAGNVGSPTRLNYTVLGDGVNLASRLEGLTKRYLVPIVAGSSVREATTGIVYRELDKVRVRGRSVPERIFEPLGREGEVDGGMLALLQRWHAALEDFRGRRWREARLGFEALAAERAYARVAALHLGYLRELDARPPGPDWDAAFTLYDK